MVATVIQLARALRLDVVGEGIETEEELDVLSTVGCGYGQGYVVSRPMSHRDALRWLQDEVVTSPGDRRQ
jgi:EAL domain-containing protein (putative c-di-GMP-specific phosphodiesterase class I)